jgi:flagellar basal-body rod protein FlgG
MRIDSHGYYIADAGMIQGRAEGEVHQGALEESNVAPVDEMVQMIQTQRSYEAGSTVMQLISQTYRRLNDFR